MGFFMEDSSFILTHLLYKAALIFTISRFLLSWLITFKKWTLSPSSPSSPSSSIMASHLTTFEERIHGSVSTCGVCLSQLKQLDKVRELNNCCHVFHKECIEKWVDVDDDNNHKTCPLCRTPLLIHSSSSSSSQSLCCSRSEPSWAVERLLYLFGDDLLP